MELDGILADFYDTLAYYHGDGNYGELNDLSGDYLDGFPIDWHSSFDYNGNYPLDWNPFPVPKYRIESESSDYDDPWTDGYYTTDSDYYDEYYYDDEYHDYQYTDYGKFEFTVPDIDYPDPVNYPIVVEPTI